ncbi:unnamed protein product [Soboliphyme baturini]|uniref:rhomboid protease n=1 Tax=Soboliphyme baturini TaxID=241478 RepID=A0A3P7ZA10_9BILA|nr:unnamed protein product [Soboliphyme baturini]
MLFKISNKRRHSFKAALDGGCETLYCTASSLSCPHCSTKACKNFTVAEECIPISQTEKYHGEQCVCCPPPVFMPLVTIIELAFFLYYSLPVGDIGPNGPVPVDSIFIYRPDKRLQIWRFILYMVLHAGWLHLLFNLTVQLVVGLPLEMVHGSARIAIIYMAGVLAGSLGTSVFDAEVYLVGASGGVYALLAAHVANVFLNYSHIECGIFRIFAIILIASADVGFAIWDRYAALSAEEEQPVSYVAHLAGAAAGLTIGLLVLKNFEQRLNEQLLWWIALSIYGACMTTAIIWNIFFY